MATGERGGHDREQVLAAADGLVVEKGTPDAVSLRMVAAALGVTANALYTYVESLDDVFHELADRRLARLDAVSLLGVHCRHCALTELFRRAEALYRSPGTLALLKRQPALGPHSFRLSETVMTLCDGGRLGARDAHDLIMGWFYGNASLDAQGWTSGTDRLRAAGSGATTSPASQGVRTPTPRPSSPPSWPGWGSRTPSLSPNAASLRAPPGTPCRWPSAAPRPARPWSSASGP